MGSSGGSSTDQALLRFDGADSSTTVTDEFGNTWTAYGNANIQSSSPWKSGEKHIDLDGSGDYIKTTDNNPSGDNFTIRFRMKIDSLSSPYSVILSSNANYSFTLLLHSGFTNPMYLGLSSNNSGWDISANPGSKSNWTSGQWYELELSYDSSYGYRFYVDGVLDQEVLDTTPIYNPAGFRFGTNTGGSYGLNGQIADVYFTNTETLHTSNFTPSTDPYSTNGISWGTNHITHVIGTDEDDVITGDSQDNRLVGGLGNDSLSGSTGNDTYELSGEFGNDTISDTSGSDTLSLSSFTSNVSIDLTQTSFVSGSNTVIWGSDDIENLETGSGNDTLTGNSSNNTLSGGSGNDSLIGGTGDDTYVIAANFGHDTITETSGSDTLDASAYLSGLTIDLTQTSVVDGTNTISWSSNALENATGGSGNDVLTGNSDNNVLSGQAGDDTLTGGAGDDTMSGGLGDDTYFLETGFGLDSLSDDDGQNTLDISALSNNNSVDLTDTSFVESAGNTILWGTDNIAHVLSGSGHDTLLGNAQDNHLEGGSGSDTLTGGAGDDRLMGGSDNDTYSGFSLSSGADMINDVSGTDVASFTGLDTTDATWSLGDGNNDGLIDQLIVDFGNGHSVTFQDYFDNTASNLGASGQGSGVIESLIFDDDADVTWSDAVSLASADVGTGSDDVLMGTLFDDTIDGGAGHDTIQSLSGNDSLMGGTGNDEFILQGGNDTITDSSGDETYTVYENFGVDTITDSSGQDTLNLANFTTDVTVDLSAQTFTDSFGSTLSWSGSVIEDLTTGSGQDHLIGDSNANTLEGGDDNDTLDGAAGNDTLKGQAGNDTYQFQTGFGLDTITDTEGDNTLDFTQFLVGLTLSLAAGSFVKSAGNTVTWSSSTITNLTGSQGNDQLTGNEGHNTLSGDAGDDTLIGGAGHDTLNGGSGINTYVFNSGFGQDTVVGSNGTDILDFSNLSTNLDIDLSESSMSESVGNEVHWTVGDLEGVIAGSGNDTLTGYSGTSTLTGGAGNDQLIGSTGHTTYAFASGFGLDTITNASGGEDTLDFSAFTSGIEVDISQPDFVEDAFNTLTWTVGEIENIIGGSGNDTLTGYSNDNRLEGGAGNDALDGDVGNDTYIFNLGDGQDTVTDTDSSTNTDTVLFGSSINTSHVAFYMNGDDLEIGYVGTSDKITITDQDVSSDHEIERFELSDGQYLTAAEVEQVIQDMTAYASANSIGFTSLDDVKADTDLMNIVSSGWNPAA